ncbi:RagB/SusD family nutrient uptake outer membrane protein [Flavisolibacter ginsenosidimutans]|uniref:RagB/SusD family nutrient uptake outer membrane protein n=1 Tax=Flavisolibacter ginsenosidimutans TaxID=661481 RepID=A0A5B8UP16_9BACT|nr:RagB/SusD family nutrient uptake outer membrane protein [Flavisolibacter ginsenosidimutans]QEC57780.1 RagB/SusD family nutrient uptake outer membrane protein [Flavisolibacter ginsenosidimutans]
MKLNNKFLLLICGGSLALASCKKELDKQPTDSFSNTNAYQTIAQIQLGVNEAYGRYSAYANDMYVNALVSDESKLGSGNAGQGALTYRFQYTSDATAGGDVTSAYFSYYAMIDQINTVLSYLPTVAAAPSDEPRRNALKGQLLALRGIAHFSLLEFYSDRYDANKLGVPIMLQSDVFAKPKRSTMGEVMAQIEKDLSAAKDLLPSVNASTFSDTVMNQINVTGYQARIALYKRDYQSAINYATTVINSAVKPLSSGATFQDIWTDANNAETLFRRRYASSASIGSLWTTTGGLIYIAPSDKLVASYASTDIRKATYIGGSSGNYYVNKFFTSSRGGRAVDIKAMRIAEMYLIRAEAYARNTTPDLVAGAADLNALRTARITGYVNQTFGTADALVSAVMDERFKELCFEGFRFFDLKRNGLPVQRLASDANAAWQTLTPGDYRFIMPIPGQEILANPNTVQNPGY